MHAICACISLENDRPRMCLVNLSLGNGNAYPESSDAIAVQRVIDAGGKDWFLLWGYDARAFVVVYVIVAAGNDGTSGIQTTGTPSNLPTAIAVASIDNMEVISLFIIALDGRKITYRPGAILGGWKSIVNSTIIVHSQFLFC